jgi:hypothetical protein
MVLGGVALGHEPYHRTGHAQIEEAQVVDGRDCEDPNTIGDVPEPMDDERHQEEPDRDRGRSGEPVRQNAPGDVPNAQLQAKTSFARNLRVVQNLSIAASFQCCINLIGDGISVEVKRSKAAQWDQL